MGYFARLGRHPRYFRLAWYVKRVALVCFAPLPLLCPANAHFKPPKYTHHHSNYTGQELAYVHRMGVKESRG